MYVAVVDLDEDVGPNDEDAGLKMQAGEEHVQPGKPIIRNKQRK